MLALALPTGEIKVKGLVGAAALHMPEIDGQQKEN
jgi:hypothetical protein